ncbi:hypothetical protein BGZ49_002543 [Haplosporangium sp. Z 27]|nr:hypothetical protein BGZ49_002543 [Haplosporangium sp. Z 27]
MGACCGKPSRKDQGYVLGGSNATSTNTSSIPKAQQQTKSTTITTTTTTTTTGGRTLGGSPSSLPPPTTREGQLSASALAAQKRAEAAENRGVKQGGGKLAKKLADQNKQSPFAVEERMPEPTNADWN